MKEIKGLVRLAGDSLLNFALWPIHLQVFYQPMGQPMPLSIDE
jgi:hypothetical protein